MTSGPKGGEGRRAGRIQICGNPTSAVRGIHPRKAQLDLRIAPTMLCLHGRNPAVRSDAARSEADSPWVRKRLATWRSWLVFRERRVRCVDLFHSTFSQFPEFRAERRDLVWVVERLGYEITPYREPSQRSMRSGTKKSFWRRVRLDQTVTLVARFGGTAGVTSARSRMMRTLAPALRFQFQVSEALRTAQIRCDLASASTAAERESKRAAPVPFPALNPGVRYSRRRETRAA